MIRSRVSFNSSAFDPLPGWAAVMVLEHDAEFAALADPAVRAELRAGAESVVSANSSPVADYAALVVADTHHESRSSLGGRSIGEIARDDGQDPFDVLCHLVIADDLRTGFIPRPPASDATAWAIRAETWHDERIVISGAHADIVVFDADTVDAGPIEWRNDLPAGAGRLYAEPVGIAHVLVNGVEVVGAGQLRAVRPGTVLRRGRDLTTDR